MMNSSLIACKLMLFAIIFEISASAEDWTTSDGQVYKNVTVVKAEPDAITIIYQEGGALVSLAKLPADLQKRFNYDPDKAKLAAATREKTNTDSGKSLLIERAQAAKLDKVREAQQKADQKAATDRIAAITNTPPDPGIPIANPKDYVNGDILGKPK